MIYLLQVIIVGAILWTVLTQLVLPIIEKRPLWPAFKSKAKIEEEIIAAKSRVRVDKKKIELQDIEAHAEDLEERIEHRRDK